MNAKRPKQWYYRKKTGTQSGKWGLPIMNHELMFPQIMIAHLLAFHESLLFHESHFQLTTQKTVITNY